MPELPEVETITQDLKQRLIGRVVIGAWTDWPSYFKSSGGFDKSRNILARRQILNIERRGKNILFEFSGGYIMAVHLKMTGQLLLKKPDQLNNVHFILELRSDLGIGELYFSDARKFGRIIIGEKDWVLSRPEIQKLGPDPLSITAGEFLMLISQKRGRIKTILMNQEILSGMGNIYSDEALYLAKTHPLSLVGKIPQDKLKLLFQAMVAVLKKSLKLRGATRRDYRDPSGHKGDYFAQRLVYARRGEKCCCGGIIAVVKVNSRASHFCPKCQELYK